VPAASLQVGVDLFDRFLAAAAHLNGLAAQRTAAQRAESETLKERALAASWAAAVIGPGLVLAAGSILLWLALRPVTRLARVANRLAAGLEPAIPHARRRDEVGTLARALVSWRQEVASQRATWHHSPIGMLTLGSDFRMLDSNPALIAMFGYGHADVAMVGKTDIFDATHPDDLAETRRLYKRVIVGEIDHGKLEKRYIHRDGSIFWGSLTVAVVRDAEGQPLYYANLIEDISERKEILARAAQVQRDLLPDSAPALEGYDLTGLCQPSEEVGGDFFDWYQPDPGTLVLTLGDVMGKGMPAAILMATMRIALRAASWTPSVAETVQFVADFTLRDLEKAEAFMTLFHARLDLKSGLLTYVDAGHGLMVVASEGGRVRTVPGTRSLPLGMLPGQTYREASVKLRPGDSLIAISDGVLDVHPQLDAELEAMTRMLLEGAVGAQDMAERLATNPSAEITDDVTVVVLRRRAAEKSRQRRQRSLVTLDSQA
jgi:PAS domain S-box-containing protein